MIKKYYDLLAINILSVLLIILIATIHSTPLRIILGLPFVLFAPGYVFVSAIFVKAGSLSLFERIALGFGFSIVASSLFGLALNYMPWGITLCSITATLAIFITLASAIICYRRSREPDSFLPRLPHIKTSPLLLLAVLVAVGSLAFTIGFPKSEEKFTEFYILGLNGKADSYPHELAVDEQGGIIVGIINREHIGNISYYLEVKVSNESIGISNPIILNNDEKWEQPVSFRLWQIGDNQKVAFILYKESKPYEECHLWLNVP